jgi:hypothetical protein
MSSTFVKYVTLRARKVQEMGRSYKAKITFRNYSKNLKEI